MTTSPPEAPRENIERALPDDVESLKALVLEQRVQLATRGAEIEQLKLLIAKLRRMQFGRSSERLDRSIEQMELRLEELQSTQAALPPAPRPKVEEKSKPVRRPLPEHLPRECLVHEPACTCPDCGRAMRKIGEDISEVLDYVPARFRVIRHVRPKLACPECERIVQIEAPSRPIDRGAAGPGLLAHVLVSKYADHLPLYRQSEIYAREGVELERSTLAEWVGGCFRLLDPLIEALAGYVLKPGKLHADDTPVPVLDPGRGKTKTGRLWTYVRDDRPAGSQEAPAVLFRFSPDRRGEHPRQHLAEYQGILQADAYSGFGHLYEDGKIGRRPAGRTPGGPSTTSTRQTNPRSPPRRSSASEHSIPSSRKSADALRMREPLPARHVPDHCSKRCVSGCARRSPSYRRNRNSPRRSATCSRAGPHSPATATMATSRSTTTPPSGRCVRWRSGARITCSVDRMPEASGLPGSTA